MCWHALHGMRRRVLTGCGKCGGVHGAPGASTAKRPWPCRSRCLRRPPRPEQLQEVVHKADQAPLRPDLPQIAKREATEAPRPSPLSYVARIEVRSSEWSTTSQRNSARWLSGSQSRRWGRQELLVWVIRFESLHAPTIVAACCMFPGISRAVRFFLRHAPGAARFHGTPHPVNEPPSAPGFFISIYQIAPSDNKRFTLAYSPVRKYGQLI